MTTGQYLRAARLAANLTQAAAAKLAGVSQWEVSRVEADRSRNAKVIQALRDALTHDGPLSPGTVPEHVLLPTKIRWTSRKPETSLDVRLNQARLEFGKDFVNSFVRTLTERDVSVLATIHFDSGWEALFAVRLIQAGWMLARASPQGLGCLWFVRDRKRPISIPHVKRWVLMKRTADWTLVLMPQVTIHANPVYRMDFPGVAFRGDDCRAEWRAEVDGPHHRNTQLQDLANTLAADLPTIRIDRNALLDPLLPARLEAFALPLCKARPRTRESWS